MLVLMINLASAEILYCSKIFAGSLTNWFLNSGSFAALSRISLMVSASFRLESKYVHDAKFSYISLMRDIVYVE
jgi:hypothetical protein